MSKKPATKKGAGGRPLSGPEPLDESITLRLSKTQKAKLEKMGGGAWIRKKIDAAKVE